MHSWLVMSVNAEVKWSTFFKWMPSIKIVGADVDNDVDDWCNTHVFPRMIVRPNYLVISGILSAISFILICVWAAKGQSSRTSCSVALCLATCGPGRISNHHDGIDYLPRLSSKAKAQMASGQGSH